MHSTFDWLGSFSDRVQGPPGGGRAANAGWGGQVWVGLRIAVAAGCGNYFVVPSALVWSLAVSAPPSYGIASVLGFEISRLSKGGADYLN